jgi:aminoglycoside/choline kinase family phosphotransferase
MGNLMQTTVGLLWTDWEDTFSGPVEWDLASIVWNSLVLDDDHASVNRILDHYRSAGGHINPQAFQQSLIARAAVMTSWYPILYPDLTPDRRSKLNRRLEWLKAMQS